MVEYDAPTQDTEALSTVDVAIDPTGKTILVNVKRQYTTPNDFDPYTTKNAAIIGKGANPQGTVTYTYQRKNANGVYENISGSYEQVDKSQAAYAGKPIEPILTGGDYRIRATFVPSDGGATLTSAWAEFTVLSDIKYYYNYDGKAQDGTTVHTATEVFKSLTAQQPASKIAVASAAQGVPTRQYYTFLGWSENKDAATATYSANSSTTLTITNNHNLYAIWRLNKPGSITKTATNVTVKAEVDAGGATRDTQIDDIIEYVVTVKNDVRNSCWKNVTVTDALPNTLELQPSATLSVTDQNGATVTTGVSVSQDATTVTAQLGDLAYDWAGSGSDTTQAPVATITFRAKVVKPVDARSIDNDHYFDLDIGNVASVTGKDAAGSDVTYTTSAAYPDNKTRDKKVKSIGAIVVREAKRGTSVMVYTYGRVHAGQRLTANLQDAADAAATINDTPYATAHLWAVAATPAGKVFAGWKNNADDTWVTTQDVVAGTTHDVYPVYFGTGTNTGPGGGGGGTPAPGESETVLVVRDATANHNQVMVFSSPYTRVGSGSRILATLESVEPDDPYGTQKALEWANKLQSDGGGKPSSDHEFVGWTDCVDTTSADYNRLIQWWEELAGGRVKVVYPVYTTATTGGSGTGGGGSGGGGGGSAVGIIVRQRPDLSSESCVDAQGDIVMTYTNANTSNVAAGDVIPIDLMEKYADARAYLTNTTSAQIANHWASTWAANHNDVFVGWTDNVKAGTTGYNRILGIRDVVTGVHTVWPVFRSIARPEGGDDGGIEVHENTTDRVVMLYTPSRAISRKTYVKDILPSNADNLASTGDATAVAWANTVKPTGTVFLGWSYTDIGTVTSNQPVVSGESITPEAASTKAIHGLIPSSEKWISGWAKVYPVYLEHVESDVGIVVHSPALGHPTRLTYLGEHGNAVAGEVMVNQNTGTSGVVPGRLGKVADDHYLIWDNAYDWATSDDPRGGKQEWANLNGVNIADVEFVGWTDDATTNRLLSAKDLVSTIHDVYPVYVSTTSGDRGPDEEDPVFTTNAGIVVHRRNGDTVLKYTPTNTAIGNPLLNNLTKEADGPYTDGETTEGEAKAWKVAQTWAEENAPTGMTLTGWTHNPVTNVLIQDDEQVDGVEHVYPVYVASTNGNSDCGIVVCDRWDGREITTYLKSNNNCELGDVMTDKLKQNADYATEGGHEVAEKWAKATCPPGHTFVGWTDCIDSNSPNYNRLLGVNDLVTGMHHVYPVYVKTGSGAPSGTDDPDNPTFEVTKGVQVVTNAETSVSRLVYTVEAHNLGAPGWVNVTFMDMLPREGTLVEGTDESVVLVTLDSNGEQVGAAEKLTRADTYSDSNYVIKDVEREGGTRQMLSYRVFSPHYIGPGSRLALRFIMEKETTTTSTSIIRVAQDDENVALVTGWPVPENVDDPATYDPSTGDGYDPENPPIHIWSNTAYPNPGGLYTTKQAEAAEDGLSIHYSIEAYNSNATESYNNVSISDKLPALTTIVPGSVKLTVSKDNTAPTGGDRPTDAELAEVLVQIANDARSASAGPNSAGPESVDSESAVPAEPEGATAYTADVQSDAAQVANGQGDEDQGDVPTNEDAAADVEQEESSDEEEPAAETAGEASDNTASEGEASEQNGREDAVTIESDQDVDNTQVDEHAEGEDAKSGDETGESTVNKDEDDTATDEPQQPDATQAMTSSTEKFLSAGAEAASEYAVTYTQTYGGGAKGSAGLESGTSIVSTTSLELAKTASDGAYVLDEGTNTFAWRGTGMTMEPGMHYIIEFDVKATDPAVASSTVSNQSTVTAFPTSDPESPVSIGVEPEGADFGDLIQLEASKESKNMTRDDGTNLVGDTIRWTVTVKNVGIAVAPAVTITDPLPEGVEYTEGSAVVQVDGVQLSGSVVSYDAATRTLAVAATEVHPTSSLVLTFDTVLTADAVGKNVVNTATIGGGPVDPPTCKLPGDGSTGNPPVTIPPVQKVVEELGPTATYRDVLEYKVTLHNPNSSGAPWTDLTMFDFLPEELVYISGTMTLKTPDGKTKAMPDKYYHDDTHTIEVPVASIANGETYVVTYRVGLPDDKEPAKETTNNVKVEGMPGQNTASATIDLRGKKRLGLAHTADPLGTPLVLVAGSGLLLAIGAGLRRRRA